MAKSVRGRSGSSKSPAKKRSASKTPSRKSSPSKKSKTPSRKGSKSPARSRATTPKSQTGTKRARSRSTSRATTPRKTPSVKSRTPSTKRARSSSKSPPKSTSKKTSVSRKSSTASSRSRSSSRSTASKRKVSPLQAIQHKIQKATPDFLTPGPRSRRAAHELNRFAHQAGHTTSKIIRREVPTYWHRFRTATNRFVRGVQRRFAFPSLKRHIKRNWRKYALAGAVGAAAYFSYHNHRAIQKALNEQYNKLAALVEQQKDKNAFSKYFSG